MRAIDVRAAMSTTKGMIITEEERKALEEYLKKPFPVETDAEMAQHFIDADVVALLTPWDTETYTGSKRVTNEAVAELVQAQPEAFAGGWAMVDPWKGQVAIRELETAIKTLGLIGLYLYPSMQGFAPNDRHFYPLYEKCLELKVPLMFHNGYFALGSGAPGGLGYRLKYSHPMLVDDVAADFPGLTIILSSPSWPWQTEAIAVLLHKGNVYNELSGWLPKYYTPEFKKEINSRLQDKVMFGSDFPAFSPASQLDLLEAEGYKPEVLEKVLVKNAQRVLGIGK